MHGRGPRSCRLRLQRHFERLKALLLKPYAHFIRLSFACLVALGMSCDLDLVYLINTLHRSLKKDKIHTPRLPMTAAHTQILRSSGHVDPVRKPLLITDAEVTLNH